MNTHLGSSQIKRNLKRNRTFSRHIFSLSPPVTFGVNEPLGRQDYVSLPKLSFLVNRNSSRNKLQKLEEFILFGIIFHT